MNKVMLIGNLGADVELKFTPKGSAVATLRLATNESWMDKDGKPQKRTEWHRVIVWGEQAKNCQKFLAKGRQVHVDGRLQTRSWDDKEGKKRYATEVVANRVLFLGGPRAGTSDAVGSVVDAPSDAGEESAPEALL
jgi:single-strand DNA-binding protein